MKKYFLSIVALAGMLFATSCQESIVEPQEVGTTTFTIEVPGQMGTKAFGDAGNVDKLFVQVYSADGEKLIYSIDREIAVSTTVTLSLIQDQQYDIIFWAQKGMTAYDTQDLKAIPVVNSDYHNNDNGAAFFASLDNYTPVAEPQKIKLRRPFAQLNLGTSFGSLSTNAGDVVISRSSVVVTNVASHFNAFEGKGFGSQTLTYSLVKVPGADEKLKVGETEYKYISMDYLSIASDDQALVTVEAVIETNLGNVSQTFKNVPVKENYRTNIVGNLVSTSAEFTVSVDEAWDGVENYPDTDLENLYVAAANGGEVTLTGDVVLKQGSIEVYKDMVVDLNGYAIRNLTDGDYCNVFVAYEGANLVIKDTKGTGIVETEASSKYAIPVWARGGKISIYGGSYYSNGKDNGGSEVVYASGNGQVTINGGLFQAKEQSSDVSNQWLALNCHDASYRNGTANIVVKGGSYYKFNPANNLSEGANTNFVAEGYKSIEKGDYYFVVPEVVTTASDLIVALDLGGTVELGSDIDFGTQVWQPVGTSEVPFTGVIDGKNHTIKNLTVEATDYAAFIAYAGANTQIKNLTFENVNIQSTKHAAGVVCITGDGLVLENVKVSGTVTAASYAGGLVHNGAKVTIKNCENNANVTASRAGGIASWVTVGANIENVLNTGNVTGEVGASGIAHGFAGSIKNAKNYGNITSNNVEAAAGIAGVQKATSTYEYCYNYGEVKSTYDNPNSSAAGILGQNPGSSSTLNYCANYGDVTAEKSYAAGIAYSLYGSINANYCYNKGNISGADGAGAIAPKAQYGTTDKANCCLNSGIITSQNGVVYQGSMINTNCYYYNANQLYDVDNNSLVLSQDVINVLNGGADNDFFSLDTNRIIVVLAE